MRSIKYFLRLVARYVLGGTFVFSGFVKAVDPMGSAYKIQDYFTAFGMSWLSGAALVFAVILSWAELTLGILMILDELRPVAVWGIAGFMAIFTPLTLYLAIANPVSDCGCFGDAIKLTNWETFGKNVVLLLFVALLLVGGWKNRIYVDRRRSWLQAVWWVFIGGAALLPSLYALRHLPLIDFRPYRIGASFVEGRAVPPGAPVDQYATTFVYEKDGVSKEFTEEDYPWDDSTWSFVDSKTELIAKGYEPPMGNFRLIDALGVDVTDSLMADDGYLLLGVSPFLENIGEKDAERWSRLAGLMVQRGERVVLATSSIGEAVTAFSKQHRNVSVVTADERVLKTIVRADLGVVLVQHGVIVGKWRMRDVPIDGFADGDLLGKAIRARERRMDLTLACALIGLLLAVRLLLVERRSREKERFTAVA